MKKISLLFAVILICLLPPTRSYGDSKPSAGALPKPPLSSNKEPEADAPSQARRRNVETGEAEPLPDTDNDKGESGANSSEVVIKGRVFYNDRRENGLFAMRKSITGSTAAECNSIQTGCSPNWLAAKYFVVEALEIDDVPLNAFNFNCKRQDTLARATVNSAGEYTLRFPFQDGCGKDRLVGVAIQLIIETRFCGGKFCVSMNDDRNDPYSLSHRDATLAQPLVVRSAGTITMTDSKFSTAADTDQPNTVSIAANYYASAVDTMLTLHRDTDIPFFKKEFGEIRYIYPSNKSSTATTRSPTEIAISEFERDDRGRLAWINGRTPAHEYGHVLMLRAWDGDYGFKGVGISANDSERARDPQIAFKEAWAQLIARAVMSGGYACDTDVFDDNNPDDAARYERNKIFVDNFLPVPGVDANKPVFGPSGEGFNFRFNVQKALCDWYDGRVDDDLTLAGNGDRFAAEDIYSMWFNLRRMYLDRKGYGGEYRNPGLQFCDWVDYYLKVRKSASAVGAAEHDKLVSSVTNLIYNNNIRCARPAPSP